MEEVYHVVKICSRSLKKVLTRLQPWFDTFIFVHFKSMGSLYKLRTHLLKDSVTSVEVELFRFYFFFFLFFWR